MDLGDRVALVTGGGTGIGRATCLLLADRGAHVVVNYSRSDREAAETAARVRQRGRQALAFRADVGRDDDVRAMVAATAERFGRLDVLVNNAAITRHIPLAALDDATDEVWSTLLQVNLLGMFYAARAAAPHLRAARGAIVNVGSMAGITGSGSSLPYSVSKAAVHGLTRSLARALAPEVRVNAVAPGAVATRWWAGRESDIAAVDRRTLIGHTATPEDVAEAVVALVQQESVTGQVLRVDGGETL
jgi:3-oxoacyl-[acyl-carrier protein] reductase